MFAIAPVIWVIVMVLEEYLTCWEMGEELNNAIIH